MDLKHRFISLCSNYTNDENLTNQLYQKIDKCYSEYHRAYHNKTHLQELFTAFDAHKKQLKQPDMVAFSIFYHDIIYSIWKKDNEEKSADFAVKEITKINLSSNSLRQIHQQIVATKNHKTEDDDTKWLVDFDLAILGQSSEIYQKYVTLIRKEYRLVPSFFI